MMGKMEYGICTSEETPIKQKHFVGILRWQMMMARAAMEGVQCSPIFYMYDLNAARSEYTSKTGDSIIGSSVSGVKMAEELKMKYKMTACELIRNNADELKKYFASNENVKVLQGDNRKTLKLELPPQNEKFIPIRERYGYVYVDPNDAFIPIDLLSEMLGHQFFRRVDLILYVAGNSVKRGRRFTLDDLIKKVTKKVWLIREPHGTHQWTFVFGTNYEGIGEWQKEGFYKKGTPKGDEIWERITKTQKQLREEEMKKRMQNQPRLISLKGESYQNGTSKGDKIWNRVTKTQKQLREEEMKKRMQNEPLLFSL
jgi:hypothetical protein